LRSNLIGGRIARVMFCMAHRDLNILHGFLKTTQKTPSQDLDLAKKRLKEVSK
jgi:phage-related protein